MEIDVVMDANTPLWKAHDISQQLQDKIEVLPNVGRAFVHVDHETTHTPVPRLFISLSTRPFSDIVLENVGTPQDRLKLLSVHHTRIPSSRHRVQQCC